MGDADLRKLADGAENASRVLWRWASEQSGPWDRATSIRVSQGMARIAAECRDLLSGSPGKEG